MAFLFGDVEQAFELLLSLILSMLFHSGMGLHELLLTRYRFHFDHTSKLFYILKTDSTFMDGSDRMKTISEWLDEYSESHQNKTNKLIHWVCVPAIYFSIIGIMAHFSALLTALLLVLAFVFYARLDIVLAVAMAALTLMMAWFIWILPVGIGFFIALFVFAWIGQFYGHKVEGKKPSFFKDLQFLLIGPLWCMDAYLGKVLPKWKSRQSEAIQCA